MLLQPSGSFVEETVAVLRRMAPHATETGTEKASVKLWLWLAARENGQTTDPPFCTHPCVD
jgi:hypothetical protein